MIENLVLKKENDLIENIDELLPSPIEKLTEDEIKQIKNYMSTKAGGEMVYNAKLDKLVKAPVKLEDELDLI